MTSWLPQISDREGPRYRAIADALAEDVGHGRLGPGTRLPTHRDLAYQLGVTVGTITRAYAEAERRGLVGGEVGRGTFVRGAPEKAPATEPFWQPPSEPSVINLAVCLPHSPGVEQAIASAVASLAESGRLGNLLGYSPHGGLPAHRAAGAQWLARQHRAIGAPEQIVVTLGAQNAMAVAFAAIARAGDTIVTERLTYHGMKAVASTLGLQLEGVAIDEHGLIPEHFEQVCRRSAPRALYTVPTLHNPTAAISPVERRAEIVEIARHYDVTIVEDDVFGFLAPNAPPPIQTMAPDITVYLTSLSKSIAAGLRVGYLLAPLSVIPRVEAAMRALQYSAPPLLAELASRWILDGSADRFAQTQRTEALARQALARDLLPPATVGGDAAAQHLWLNLPEPWRREDFVHELRRRGVSVTGADAFVVGRVSAPHAVRLGLCMPRSREELAHGLGIIAATLDTHVGAGLMMV
ncbi:MAG: aminotransferase class I/II-fold pyridoxal phosphate-dependent enzyme [Azospirillum sp.]|nr:aminotransferase class I/II-fold pyridoxal phosphate-dependent enzyme [Azospirillum sp.]